LEIVCATALGTISKPTTMKKIGMKKLTLPVFFEFHTQQRG